MKSLPEIIIEFTPSLPPALVGLFQKGLKVEVELGTDLITLLHNDLCLSDEGIDRIQTIFWQGQPVDDLQNCLTVEGGVLALSAALPGLVGACLRRGGAWARLRSSITHSQEETHEEHRRGWITVKLFNFMLREIGPILLERGVLMDKTTLLKQFALPEVRKHAAQITLDESPINDEQLESSLDNYKNIFVHCRSKD